MLGNALPDKLFFKIGEVAQIVGVAAHVLRYWESEFSALRPLKTRGSHRVYRRRDVELALQLKRLLHEEGLTIAGAKRRLRERSTPSRAPRRDSGGKADLSCDDYRAELLALRGELTDLLVAITSTSIDGPDEAQLAGETTAQEAARDGVGRAEESGTASSVAVHQHQRPGR